MEMSDPIQVEIFTRPGCHLCDDAKAVIERVQQRYPFVLKITNIEEDSAQLICSPTMIGMRARPNPDPTDLVVWQDDANVAGCRLARIPNLLNRGCGGRVHCASWAASSDTGSASACARKRPSLTVIRSRRG